MQELHSEPAPDTPAAAGASQKRSKVVCTPATGANTVPIQYTTSYARDSIDPASSSQHSAAAPNQLSAGFSTQPATDRGSLPAAQQADVNDALQIATLIELLAEGYAADPLFADEARTASLIFSEGLW